jgi:hypothetical protein
VYVLWVYVLWVGHVLTGAARHQSHQAVHVAANACAEARLCGKVSTPQAVLGIPGQRGQSLTSQVVAVQHDGRQACGPRPCEQVQHCLEGARVAHDEEGQQAMG